MTQDYRQPFGFNKKRGKEVRSFISTFPKEYSGYVEEFDCFDAYYLFIKEPYHKPNHEKRSNSHRHVAAYCCPGAYWYKPYTKPRDSWGCYVKFSKIPPSSLISSENGKD